MPASRILRFARTSRCAIVGAGHEKRARDLVGLEAAERAQRQRDLGLERQRRVAAGEDQPQPIVGDLAGVVESGSSMVRLNRDGAVRVERFLGRRLPRGCGRWPCGGRSG